MLADEYLMRIDSHQHFWQYDPVQYDWIDGRMARLKIDFLPPQLENLLGNNAFDGCIAVQARQSEDETRFLLNLADQYDFIKGVVGWVDLCSSNVKETLARFSQSKKLCGIRHAIQDEQDDLFMLRDDFQQGVSTLAAFDLAYDILIYPKHLEPAWKLVHDFPNQRFVIDHIAKPFIKERKIDSWSADIQRMVQLPNVYCKVSGMVTEASWDSWHPSDFTPYLDVVFESFGVDKIMIGSDWPVCLLAGSYNEVIDIVTDYISTLELDADQEILGLNACNFYKLK
jgi:L-fuconolactonase